jgi:hypothetical protein
VKSTCYNNNLLAACGSLRAAVEAEAARVAHIFAQRGSEALGSVVVLYFRPQGVLFLLLLVRSRVACFGVLAFSVCTFVSLPRPPAPCALYLYTASQ